jgi:hypothetical protein
MTLPVTVVEIAFATAPDDPSPVWVDVTQWWRSNSPISITRGRQDHLGEVQPSKLTLTLENSDGRFTPGNVNSPYYPNIKKGRKIRVSQIHDITRTRFTGYVDEWPVAWADASTKVADATITASSRMARLGRGVELLSIIEEEYLSDGPAVYYTMGDAAGSTQAGNKSTTDRPPLSFAGAGANPVFGDAVGPSTDGMTAVSLSGGKYLQAVFPQSIVTAADTTFTMECFFLTSATNKDLVRLDLSTGTGEASVLAVTSAGKLRAAAAPNLGANTYLLDSAASVNDGLTHHALIRETISGGNLTATLYLDGTQVGTATTAYTAFGSRDRLAAGGGGFGTITGTLAHVAVTSGTTELTAARVEAHSDAGLNGFSGESSGVRIRRLALYAGVPEGELDIATGLSTSIVNQITNGKTALALMTDVVTTEGGVLFDSTDGLLTFHARSHRYATASALTLSGSGGEILAIEPRLDDQGLLNDMTASRDGGVTVRAVDQASIDDYGLYRESITLLTTSDSEVRDAANWKVFTGSTPLVKIPQAATDLTQAGTAQQTAILAREIGDRITLANLPAQAPAESMDFFIEGYTEQITAALYQIAFNLSPAELSGAWVLDSSVYSLLGTTTRLAF